MNCPNCNTPNADGEQFCSACGTELAGAQPAPVRPIVATLTFNGKDYPLTEDGKIVIARADTDKCKPDIAIDADDVSSTPVEVEAAGGKITVRDTGTSTGLRVVKYLAPGQSAELQPGDMLMLGSKVINIG